MNNQELRKNVNYDIKLMLKNYVHIPLPKLTHFDEAVNLMNRHVWTNIELQSPTVEPMAFVKKSGGNDGVYEIYVNPAADEETEKCFILHEWGHVLFSHLEMTSVQEKFLIDKICSFWPAFKKYFTSEAAYSLTELARSLLNIAQDMEVNGKLFTRNEWEIFQHNAQVSYIEASIESSEVLLVTRKEILNWLNIPQERRKPLFLGFYPENYGFPCNLDYSQYVDLILMNKDLFFNQLISNLNKNGLSDPQKNRKLSTIEIDRLRKQCVDTQMSVTDPNLSAPEDAWKENQEFSPNLKLKTNSKKNKKIFPVIDVSNTKKLEDFILNQCNCRSVKNRHNNTMYFYNRRKYNSELLISKQTSEELYRPGNLYLLADCSGSISYESLKVIIKVIQNIARKLQKHSKIIWWSTNLNGEYPLTKAEGPDGTGGTDIAAGINYVHKKYLKNSNDKLIIISDYQDSLFHWYQELRKIKNDCIGICWKSIFPSEKMQSLQNYLNSISCNIDDEKIIPDFLTKLPTILVNI